MDLTRVSKQLRAIASGELADPALAQAVARLGDLEKKLSVIAAECGGANEQCATAEERVETAAITGAAPAPADEALARALDARRLIQERQRLVTRARDTAAAELATLQRERTQRAEAQLEPLFTELITQMDQHLEALLAIESVLAEAHGIAQRIGGTNRLAQGYGLLVPGSVTKWREKTRGARLLPAARQDVA